MGIRMLNRIRRLFGFDEAKAVAFSEGWVDGFFGGVASKSGASVSTGSAMQVPAFYRGVMVIADGLAQLPLILYRKSGRGSEPATDHPLHDLMLYKPNGWQDGMEWVRTTVMHAASSGAGVSYRNVVNGELRELIPIKPEHCQIDIQPTLDLKYCLTFENGQYMEVGRNQVFHLRGPSWDSARGLDPVRLGKEEIGLSQTISEMQAKMHQNGVKPSGMFTLDGVRPGDPNIERTREMITQMYSGSPNAGRPILAPGSLKFTPVQFNSVDSQTLDTRKHQIEEIGRLLGVFAIMLGHAGDQSPTFASAEAFFEAHVRYTLQPWIKSFISACNTQLLTMDELREGYAFRMDTSELIRGSLKDRTEYYKAALGSNGSPGWLDVDEVREDDGWNPRGMNTIFAPVGMAPAGDGGAPIVPVAPGSEPEAAKASVDSDTPSDQMTADNLRKGSRLPEECAS